MRDGAAYDYTHRSAGRRWRSQRLAAGTTTFTPKRSRHRLAGRSFRPLHSTLMRMSRADSACPRGSYERKHQCWLGGQAHVHLVVGDLLWRTARSRDRGGEHLV